MTVPAHVQVGVSIELREMPCGHFVAASAARWEKYDAGDSPEYEWLRCSEGHQWHRAQSPYTLAKEELAKAQERINALGMQNGQLKKNIDELMDERNRLARRAQAGVCSMCHRTFRQLSRHMASKHKAA